MRSSTPTGDEHPTSSFFYQDDEVFSIILWRKSRFEDNGECSLTSYAKESSYLQRPMDRLWGAHESIFTIEGKVLRERM